MKTTKKCFLHTRASLINYWKIREILYKSLPQVWYIESVYFSLASNAVIAN